MVLPAKLTQPLQPRMLRLNPEVVRVAIYRRRSTDGENQPYSIEAQDTRLLPYIDSQPGWVLVERYQDDKSGATLRRDDLQRALRDARLGKFDVLLVLRLDRLTRSIRGLLDVIDELDAAGVAFRSASEQFDTHTPVGRMTMQLLAVFAEFERSMIIERVTNGMEAKAGLGGWTAGQHPFGYGVLKDPNTGKSTWLVPNDKAPLVQVIFDKYLNARMGVNAIATWLNKQGHRTRPGKPWSQSSVLTVLRNRAYIGEVYFRGVWHNAPHPHLISRETFDAAQALLTERGDDVSRRRGDASTYLLAGLIKCAHCGKRYVGNAAHGKTRRYRYYTCFSRHRYGADTCPTERLPADELETKLLDTLLTVYQNRALMDHAISQVRDHHTSRADQHHAELTSVTTQLRQVEMAIDRYYTAFERGTMSDHACAQRVNKLELQKQELRARELEIGATLDAASVTAPDDDTLAEMRSHITLAIRNGAPLPLKGLLKALVAGITVDDRYAIHPVFRVPAGSDLSPLVSGVRIQSGYVGVAGLEPATSAL